MILCEVVPVFFFGFKGNGSSHLDPNIPALPNVSIKLFPKPQLYGLTYPWGFAADISTTGIYLASINVRPLTVCSKKVGITIKHRLRDVYNDKIKDHIVPEYAEYVT